MTTRFDTTNALCPDCRKGYHCFGTTSGCICRIACEDTNKIPDDAVYHPGSTTPIPPKKRPQKDKMPPGESTKSLREQNRYLAEENKRLRDKYDV